MIYPGLEKEKKYPILPMVSFFCDYKLKCASIKIIINLILKIGKNHILLLTGVV